VPRAMPDGRSFGTGRDRTRPVVPQPFRPHRVGCLSHRLPQQERAVSDHEISGSSLAVARSRGSHADARRPVGHPLTHGETAIVCWVRRARTDGRRRAGWLNGAEYG
jgi:hypothetical protein